MQCVCVFLFVCLFVCVGEGVREGDGETDCLKMETKRWNTHPTMQHNVPDKLDFQQK